MKYFTWKLGMLHTHDLKRVNQRNVPQYNGDVDQEMSRGPGGGLPAHSPAA